MLNLWDLSVHLICIVTSAILGKCLVHWLILNGGSRTPRWFFSWGRNSKTYKLVEQSGKGMCCDRERNKSTHHITCNHRTTDVSLWDRRPAHRAHRESAEEPSDLLSSLLIPVCHKLLTHWQGCASRHHCYLTGIVWNRPSCWHTPLSFRLKVWVHWMSCCWHFQPLLFLEETSESFCEAREATRRFITHQLNSASENECLTETGCSCLMSNWSKHHRGCQLKD